MNNEPSLVNSINKLQRIGGIMAVAGVVLGAAMAIGNSDQFFHAYLYGYIFWVCMTLGCLGMTFLHHAIKGRFGIPVIRIFEAGGSSFNLILMGVLFIPILLGANHLYPWANPDTVNSIEALKYRSGFMNTGGVGIRTAVYFAMWALGSHLIHKWSLDMDKSGSPLVAAYRTSLGCAGLVFYMLTCSFAFSDWVMSLEANWYSTIYGAWFITGSVLVATSFTTLLMTRWYKHEPYKSAISMSADFTLWRDMGNLILTMVMFWAYTSLSQFLIIWSGNIREEITFYLERNQGTWLTVGAFMICGQFFFPFLCLLSGKTKRGPGWRLSSLVVWIIIMRMVDIAWIIIPSYDKAHNIFSIPVLLAYVGSFLGIGGIWMISFTSRLKSAPVLPAYAVSLEEGLGHA